MNLKILQDLESMKSMYNRDLVMSIQLLNHLWIRYYISAKLELQAP